MSTTAKVILGILVMIVGFWLLYQGAVSIGLGG